MKSGRGCLKKAYFILVGSFEALQTLSSWPI